MADLRRQKRIQFLKRKKPLRWQNVSRGGFFLVYETSFPYDKKRSARIALQRNGRMSLARPAAGGESCFAGFFIIVQETSFPYDNKCFTRMRTRRKGRWLLKQPRLGARMCQGTFFFTELTRVPEKRAARAACIKPCRRRWRAAGCVSICGR